MRTTSDSRLALGLLLLSLLSLGAFVVVGFRPLTSRRLRHSELATIRAAPQAGTEFVDVTESLGLAGAHHDTDGVHSVADAIAPGVALVDLDQDGDLDLVQLAGPNGATGVTIWLNQLAQSGKTRFVDATAAAGIRWRGAAQGICAGDVDGDGDIDLFVTALGPNLLLKNLLAETQTLRFEDATEEAGVAGGTWHWVRAKDSQSPPRVVPGPPPPRASGEDPDTEVAEFSSGATFGDFDADGDLDLYVVNYCAAFEERFAAFGSFELADRAEPFSFQPLTFEALPDRFYRNETGSDGRLHFREITKEVGVAGDQDGRGLGVSFLLADADIYPDLYVVTDASDNVFFHNVPVPESPAGGVGEDGGGLALRRRFEDETVGFGLSDRRSGMGLARGDADSDGDLDLLTTNWRYESASLFLYRLEGRLDPELKEVRQYPFFEERGARAGIADDTAPLVGWGCTFFDFDDDGDEDLFIGNGYTSPRDRVDQCAAERPLLFMNRGDGNFDNVTASAGAALQVSYAARGVVAGDIDQDGDLDLVIAQNNGPLVVLENRRPANGNTSLTVVPTLGRQRGDATNVVVVAEIGRQRQVQELLSGSSYLSQEPFEAHFGLGTVPRAERVRVTWPWLGAPPPRILEQVRVPRISVTPKER